jgi:hypothetical protein
MRPIGFSTGALAYSDFRRALGMLRHKSIRTVELSALREAELAPLVDAIDSLDLSQFTYVSVHAPSKYARGVETKIVSLLKIVASRNWPIIVHPETLYDFSVWESFRGLVLIENMDKRNQTGRTARELELIFCKLPEAGLCFDLGHCRQVDPTMNEAFLILRDFGDRLKQLHVSEVNTRSTHDPLSSASIGAFEKVAQLIPMNVPVILESPVSEKEIDTEIAHAREALPVAAANGNRKREARALHSAAS